MAGYRYEDFRSWLSSEEGRLLVSRAASNARRLISLAGAVRWSKVVQNLGTGDSWKLVAVTERLVETGVLAAATPEGAPTTDVVFVAGPRLN